MTNVMTSGGPGFNFMPHMQVEMPGGLHIPFANHACKKSSVYEWLKKQLKPIYYKYQ